MGIAKEVSFHFSNLEQHNKNLTGSKLEALADEKLNVFQPIELGFQRREIIFRKGLSYWTSS